MSTLLSARQAIRSTLETEITAAKQVIEHAGPFTFEELGRLATRNPALVVVCQGAPAVERLAGKVFADAVFAVFVVASNTKSLARDALAMTLAGQVASLVGTQTWDDNASRAATDIAMTNLYSAQLDKHDVSLWAVRWRQRVELDFVNADTPVDLERVVATYEISATESASDQVELPT